MITLQAGNSTLELDSQGRLAFRLAGQRPWEAKALGVLHYYDRQHPRADRLPDDAVHLALETSNNLAFARVQYAFRFVEASGRRLVSLEAPEGGPVAAAYLLVTGGRP